MGSAIRRAFRAAGVLLIHESNKAARLNEAAQVGTLVHSLEREGMQRHAFSFGAVLGKEAALEADVRHTFCSGETYVSWLG